MFCGFVKFSFSYFAVEFTKTDLCFGEHILLVTPAIRQTAIGCGERFRSNFAKFAFSCFAVLSNLRFHVLRLSSRKTDFVFR